MVISLHTKVQRPKTFAETHAQAMADGAACERCPLFGCKRGPVESTFGAPGKLVVLGDYPDNDAVADKKPFSGAALKLIEAELNKTGVDPADVTYINAVACQPEDDDLKTFVQRMEKKHRKEIRAAKRNGLEPPPAPTTPVEACRARALNLLARAQPEHILAFGDTSLELAATHFEVPYDYRGGRDVGVRVMRESDQAGSPVVLDNGRVISSSQSPRVGLRMNRQVLLPIRENVRKSFKIFANDNKIEWWTPTLHIEPSYDELLGFFDRIAAAGDTVRCTIDIETDGIDKRRCLIRCIGICAKFADGEELVFVTRVLSRNGSPYWTAEELNVIKQRYAATFGRPWRPGASYCVPVYQNGAFDTAVLGRLGWLQLVVDPAEGITASNLGIWEDTLLASRATPFNDLNHGLGELARRYTDAPLWKDDVDHKAADNLATDHDLWRYNALDCLVTSRVYDRIKTLHAKHDTNAQYEIDRALFPVIREMSSLGICIDEAVRGKLLAQFDKFVKNTYASACSLVGRQISLSSSSPQLGEYLFDELGITPIINSDGFDWKSGQDWSTSTAALMALVAAGVEPRVEKFIELVLQYKAADTIRSRYLQKLEVEQPDAALDESSLFAETVAACFDTNGGELLPSRNRWSQIHPDWKLSIPTGRWASSPNVQNYPSRCWSFESDPNGNPIPTNMRTLVVAAPGHVFVGMDFSQIELRIYAVVADDALCLKAFRDGLDPHTLNAATLLAPRVEDILAQYELLFAKKKGTELDQAELKYIRTVAKRFAFLEIYGGKRGKLYSVMSAERDKATNKKVFPNLKQQKVLEWHDRWHAAHPETQKFHADVGRELRQTGCVTEPVTGRRRFFIDGTTQENAPPNMKIQGSAAGFANKAVLQCVEEIPFRKWSRWTGLNIQCHDQLMFQVPESRVDETKAILTRAAQFDFHGMPIIGDIVVSRDWARQG